jgi:hypothetical protein
MRLWRLLSCRRPSFDTSIEHMVANLAREAGVPVSELHAVIKGAEPSPQTVGQLGLALGFHTADMFVIAGLAVPQDLASAWPTSPWDVGSVVKLAMRMSPALRNRLDELVRSLPVQSRTEPVPADDYPEGPGALMLRLLRNRNIGPYNAHILAMVGGGPYVSNATMAMLGPGEIVITPPYVTGFAHLVGYAPDDMAALAGLGPVVEDAPVHPASAELAALAWNARRLTSDQLKHVVAAANEGTGLTT